MLKMGEKNSPELYDETTKSTSTQAVEADNGLSETETARLLRKIDLRVLPMLFVIYVVAFLDRANISNALTMSMPADLGLVGSMENIALAVFFPPYILFEIPSNFLMKKFTPHVWLSLCMLGFGVVMLGQGFVQSYGGLLATRFLLGVFEAGIFPGSFYVISYWYTREESQKRFAIYFCSVVLASAFGGLLASAIEKMDGLQGLSDWRWIFILEGILSIVVAAAAFFFVSDFPSEVKWLTQAEKDAVLKRTQSDDANDASTSRITLHDIATFFKDPKNYLGAIMYFAVVEPIYAFAYFTPTIIKTLGYTTIQTQLHSVPPFAAAFAMCLILAYLSDRSKYRLPFVLFPGLVIIIGLAMLMTTHGHFSLQYAGVNLVCMGAYSAGPTVICWYLMNLQGHQQRSIGSAFMVSIGNTGGIIAPFTFLTKDSPYYRVGYGVCLGSVLLGMVASICYALLILRERRKVALGDTKADQARSLSL